VHCHLHCVQCSLKWTSLINKQVSLSLYNTIPMHSLIFWQWKCRFHAFHHSVTMGMAFPYVLFEMITAVWWFCTVLTAYYYISGRWQNLILHTIKTSKPVVTESLSRARSWCISSVVCSCQCLLCLIVFHAVAASLRYSS